jgi:hypothetical protein
VVKGQNEIAPHPRGRRVGAKNRTFSSFIGVKAKKRPERKICEATLLSKGAFRRVDPSFFARDFSSVLGHFSRTSCWAVIQLFKEKTTKNKEGRAFLLDLL